MDKSVKSVKNSLKFKAQPKSGLLSVRVGVKKYVLPVDVRVLVGGSHLFLSFPSSTELYQIEGKGLKAMDGDADATKAHADLTPSGKRGTRKRSGGTEMAPELAEALAKVPSGYKLGYDKTGSLRLVRTRKRSK